MCVIDTQSSIELECFMSFMQQYLDDEKFLYTDGALTIDPVVNYLL